MIRSTDLPNMTIPLGGTDSNVLSGNTLKFLDSFTMFVPSVLTAAVTLQVSNDGGSTWFTLQSGGADIAFAVTKAVVVDYKGWDAMRMHSAGAEAADRVFGVIGAEKFL